MQPGRFKLRAWLIRFLVECNGHADLMTKAIALQDEEDSLHDEDSPTASRGVRREASLSGRVSIRILPFNLT